MTHEYPVAIVTGGGGGIGRAAAQALAADGWTLVLTGRDARKLEQTAATLPTRRALIHALDLTLPGAAEQLVDAALAAYGRIDAIANVAGLGVVASIPDTSDALWQTTMDINVTAPMRLIRAAWNAFTRQGRGVIVNVSSMASIDPFPGFAAYAPSKAALNMLTLVAAREGHPSGIRAVTIAPGAVETPMLRASFDEATIPRDKTLAPEAVGRLIADCITGRRAFEPAEVITALPEV